MNEYTAVVKYMQEYVRSTSPIFILANAQKDFSNVQSKIEYCLKVLKDHEDYTDDTDTVN